MAGMDQDLLDPDTATLWWAGKEFHRYEPVIILNIIITLNILRSDTTQLFVHRDQKVTDRVGKNEKTKVVARLQSKNAGAPTREAAISEEERKAMMAYWFKKQEEVSLSMI